MGTLGSASIKLNLDRSQFDSDLKKLQATDAGQVAYRIKLDTKDFDRQIKGLRIQSPILIPLEIDTKTFDGQIKKLSTSIDPIKVDLAPNVKDFQEKLRRLSKISPIAVEIKVDEAKVKRQFEQVGKYAAEGFTQGFSGVGDAGKSAVDSMVKSVNKQLGIQSPSKVFRDIGKYAIAGLMQGLDSVDESKLKGVVNKVENYFKNSKARINLDVDVSGVSGKVKVQAPVSPVEKATQNPGDFSKNITKSIEDGFQKAKPKANFLGAIFGGLGSLITIPLAGVLRGAFEGIGTPLGLQLGTGVTKAIQSTLGQNIGSLELISQKAVEKSLQAIPAAQSAIVEVIKSNPIGGAITKQLELLQRTLELYSINLSPQKAVKSLATDEERATASSSANFESITTRSKSRKKAKAAASNEFVSIVEQKGEVDKISESIKQKEVDLAAKAKKLGIAQSAIASLQTKQEKLRELPAPKSQTEAKARIATDASLKKQITEMSQVLMSGSISIQQDIKDIQSLKDAKSAFLEKLNKQIKILAELGIEKDLSSQTAEILKGIDVFEQLISGQKAVANARKNVKTNAKTPESIREKKLDKLQGLATSAKTNLESALSNTETDISEIPKLKKRATAANKALDLYKLEISDPAKEIEKLNQKLANGNAALAKNIQELQTRLTQAIPALFRNASEEVVKVGNLGEIAPQKPKSVVQEQKEYYSEGAILQREQGKKKEQEIKRDVANRRSETELPREYREIAKDVARLYAGIKVKSRDIPQLKASGTQQELGYSGLYDPIKNQVSVSNELFSRAQSGTLTPQDISTLTHEIIHAIDYGFGKKTQIDAADSVRNIQPTAEELRIEGGRIEGSTRFEDAEKNHGQSRDLSRTLETNAYIGDLRLSPEVIKRTEKRRAIHNFETEFGRGAPLAVSQYKGINSSVDSSYTKVQERALSSGVNIDKERKASLARQKAILEKGFSELKPLVDKARSSLHVLPTEEIIALQESLRNTLKSSMTAIEQEQAALQNELEIKTSPIKSSPTSEKSVQNILKTIPTIKLPTPGTARLGIELKSSEDVGKFIKQNLNAQGVRSIAQKMGIDTKNGNKDYLVNEIKSFGGTHQGREQLSQKISQLTSDKFLSNSSVKGATIGTLPDASKILGDLKKARKSLADALKLALNLDGKERQTALEQIDAQSRKYGAIAKQLGSEYQLTGRQGKSLGGTKTQLKNISGLANVALAETLNPRKTGSELGANLVGAIGSGMAVAATKPIREIQSVMAAIEVAAKDKAEIRSPSRVFERIGKFISEGLVLGITQGSSKVKNAIGSLINEAAIVASSSGKSLLPTPPPPPGFNLPIARTTVPPPPPGFNLPIGSKAKSALPLPPPPPGFDLPIKVKQLVDKVKDSGELLNIASDIQKDQTKNLNRKIREFDRIVQLIDDLKAEEAKQSAALNDKFDPELVERRRETIRQRAKLSAKLERKYGMTGLAPEILPDRIPELGEAGKSSPSILQGIKDIFKSLDNSVAKRVKKRAAQLAIEVDAAIAPSLEASAIDAGTRGDKVEQKQYQKLARQSRAATKGIAKILDSPGDLTEKQVKQLDRLTSQLEKVYDAIGRPLPSQGFLESIGIGAGGAIGIVKSLGGVIKGFLAFSIGMWAQNFFGSVAQEAFKAYVELDRLKVSLNFASGGTAGGAQSLAFVRKTVDDLKVPLKASTEGFVQLAAASRNSALEGKGTRELFLGISQASTVLSLSAEDTQGSILALSQMISKGKVSSEELRQQLGERLPGAMGIAARAMGQTEVEFTRLLDSGQILSQDFLPKFAKQLQAEFGDAAKDASGNAQSAIFGVQNAFLSLQQGIGEGVAPVAITGLNVFGEILKGLASVAKELGFILLGVTAALGIKMVGALQAVIAQLIAAKFATVGLGGGLAQLGQTINNSLSVKLAAGIFAALEVVNLLNQAINTELVTSFSKAADAAKRAAEETKKAFQKPKPESSGAVERFVDKYAIAPLNSQFGTKISTFAQQENAEIERGKTQGLDPIATNGPGKFGDMLINLYNKGIGSIPGAKLTTWGEYERNSTVNSIQDQGLSNVESLGEARYQLAQFKTGTGDAGKLRAVDAELKTAEEKRATLQAQIKRDYVDKGQSIPTDFRLQLESQNLNITALNEKRSEAGKPLTLELNRTIQKIGSIKTQLEQLKDPDNIANFGGEVAADKQRQNLKLQLEPLKQFKAEMETALGSLRIDPILAFTQSLRKLNLALAEGQEKSELRFNKERSTITETQLQGFSTNKLAARSAALSNAVADRNKNQDTVTDLEKALQATESTVNASGFQATLQRLGVTPDASVAKIEDVLKNTPDEADKGILEKFKSAREQEKRLTEARVGLNESRLKVRQTTQDNSLFSIDDSAANSRATTQKAENAKIAAVRNAQAARLITEEVASEKISRISLASTRSQQKNLNQQLAALRTYHDQGAISAEEFAKRERDLTTEQTNLEKQEAENRLAVQQAVIARRLKDIEFANKKAESAIAFSQTTSTIGVKTRLLTSGITASTKDSADLDQNSIDQKASVDNTALIKTKIAQNQQEYKEGRRSARGFAELQMALNLELARSHQQLIDLKIAAEEKYRAIIERNISTNRTIASTAIDKRLLAAGLTPQATDQAAIDKNKAAQKEVVDKINFIKSRVKNEKDAKDEIAALDSQLTTLKIEEEQKRRESVEHNIQRIIQAEENRFKKQISQLDESKVKLDLYNQSLERTNKLEQSRQNLSKALSDATLAPAENQKTDTDDAQALVDKLKDPSVKRRTKRAAREQLRDMGYQVNSNTRPEEIELQIKEKRIEAEKVIANIKQMALEKEQEFQRKLLENDLKRQKIAAQTLLYEAQSAQLSAQKAKNDAEGALKIAISKKDPLAIETAQTNLDIANKQIDLSNERVASAQDNLNDQPEIATNATAEQKATQSTQTESFGYGEKRRERQSALDLVETGEKARRPMSLSSAEDKVGSTSSQFVLPQKLDINQMPKLDLKPGENLFDAYQRQREGMKLPTQGAELPSSKVDMPPMDTTASSLKQTLVQPRDTTGGNQFVEALKMANQGIEQRLDALNSAIMTLANTPRSLSVSTANPVDDAADLMNRIGRGQVVEAGM